MRIQVKQARKSMALTQAEFATRCGVSRKTIWSIENGLEPSAKTIQKIAKATGKPVEWFTQELVA